MLFASLPLFSLERARLHRIRRRRCDDRGSCPATTTNHHRCCCCVCRVLFFFCRSLVYLRRLFPPSSAPARAMSHPTVHLWFGCFSSSFALAATALDLHLRMVWCPVSQHPIKCPSKHTHRPTPPLTHTVQIERIAFQIFNYLIFAKNKHRHTHHASCPSI